MYACADDGLLCCALLCAQGIKLGVSSRGWASVVTDPHSQQVVVEPDYQLITFDFVPEPSNAGAYVVPICKRYRCEATSGHTWMVLLASGRSYCLC